MSPAFNVVVALLPVLCFLATLLFMDSFRLVRPGSVLVAIAVGAAAALVGHTLHGQIEQLGVSATTLKHSVAPLTEETLKAIFIVLLIARRRLGFVVDAAIQGFAVGAGFAVVENVGYLNAMPDAPAILWIVRGFGTAVLHGAATSILAMMTKGLVERRGRRLAVAVLPGWATAVVIHWAFNNALLPPVAATLLLLTAVPLLVLYVFNRSERATREWVGSGLDLDVELLQLVLSDHFSATRLGAYLQQLKSRFPGPVVADMFCLLRLELELSAQAKAMLIARAAGVEMFADDDTFAYLSEVRYLKASIGKTGLLALEPLQVTSHRDDWHRYLLRQAPRRAAGGR